jgi:hypothetical protein
LVVYAHTEADPFTSAMLASNESVDTFLQQVDGSLAFADVLLGARLFGTIGRGTMIVDAALRPNFFHLQNPIPNTNFLFLSYDAAGSAAIQNRLQSRLVLAQNVTPEAQAAWPDHWMFAADTMDKLAANATSAAITSVLLAWQEDVRGLQYGSTATWLPRLDGHFQYCNIVARDNHSPSDPSQVGV